MGADILLVDDHMGCLVDLFAELQKEVEHCGEEEMGFSDIESRPNHCRQESSGHG